MSYVMLKNHDGNKLKCSPATENLNKNGIQDAALRFIYERCEDLRFDKEKTKEEEETKKYLGKSNKPNTIPYNMEMDIDRLCLENAARHFLESGRKEDAFDVYFCFMEMFFGDYDKSRYMVELLSEFESNGSSLLMKHRDHYSHSVYVFLLGLAIYETNEKYRESYENMYKDSLKKGEEPAHHFLHYWGLASLFHDIGYPFELPFEQVASYFEVDKEKRAGKPFLAYQQLDNYIKIDENLKRRLAKLYIEDYAMKDVIFQNTNDLFAFALADKLADAYCLSRETMRDILTRKPIHPDQFGNFMDHGYFSATILFKKMFEELKIEVDRSTVDALTAIILHNSLYKFSVAYYKDKNVENIPLKPDIHPLAYMLMLCDELQAWDRTSYGRNSRTELHPMDCEFNFDDNCITAKYYFDEEEKEKIEEYQIKYDNYKKRYEVWKTSDQMEIEPQKPKMKAYGDFYSEDFQKDIEAIVDLDQSGIHLKVEYDVKKRDNSKKQTYLSNSNFIHLYNFAVILDARYKIAYNDQWKAARESGKVIEFAMRHEKEFEQRFAKTLSLEYKLSNIGQAKGFAKHLDQIGCFYTDRSVDYEMVKEFTEEEVSAMAPSEHQRWLQRYYEMNWFGTPFEKEYEENGVKKKRYQTPENREMDRRHQNMIPDDLRYSAVENGLIREESAKANYDNLQEKDQGKDIEPLECMLDLLRLYDGLRIYRLKKK